MRNLKQILSFVLVLLLAFSTVAFTASAEDFVPSEEAVLYFEVPEDWTTYSKIFCHIWPYGGDPLANWQSKKEACTATDTEGLYSYDITAKTKAVLEDGEMYCVIFSADTGAQTYDLLFSTECFGDTAYCDGTMYENPQDSMKTAQAAFWKHQDPLKYGPLFQITSIGNTAGITLPPNRTATDVFRDFLSFNLENARTYSGKTDQLIIDDLAKALMLSAEDVDAILTESSETATWTLCWNGKTYGAPSTSDEVTPDETTPDETTSDEIVIYGDANLDCDVNIKDATLIQKVTAGLESLSTAQAKWCADVNLDGYVNIKDATSIQKYVAGLESDDCIGTETVWEDNFAPIDPVD